GEEAENESRERLMHSEMMARIGRQTAGIVHDLRSPLTVVMGNLQYALDQLDRDDFERNDMREPLEQATAAAERLLTMVKAVLKASAVKSYRDERREIAVRDIVNSSIDLAASELRRKAEVKVAHDCDARVLGVPGRLTQAVVNLLVNAAQAIPESGRVTVTTYMRDNRAHLAIRDTGIGMSREVQDRIFQPFFTTKGVGEGTGLGLAMVQQIVNEHGGTITVQSTPGVGTCFTISLPLAPASL
ncbi:MAG: HAMP domain-containing sensor histidine kinase, partial [Myxococcota bacterium]